MGYITSLKIMKFCSILKHVNFFVRQPVNVRNCKFSVSTINQNINRCDKKSNEIMKVLNVAEKNDAAKNIAAHLARGTSKRVK